ncbi:ABC transporter permease [Terrimonas ferruginea]|uniref:ABC transporter permease n=1 Tax=Terrimonas ferruginea TaxID=249 RepID=UPI00040161DD|nr:ABC transporter permease [Terrimonas ferruginea]
MKKIKLIIQREFLTRVRKRTFIISTLLFPLLYLALIFGTSYIGAKSKANLKIAVLDSSGLFDRGRIERANATDASSQLVLVKDNADSLQKNFKAMGYDGYIIVPANTSVETIPHELVMNTNRTIGSASEVQSKLNTIWDELKYEKLGIDDEKQKTLSASRIQVKPENVNDRKSDSRVASTMGVVSGFLIYFILLVYGSQVMMGVMEEKTNRIAEVMVSSVKPFQLMLGKIIGIGLVALTQFLLWIAFIFIIYNVTKASGAGSSMVSGMVGNVQSVFLSVNLPVVLGCFGFYFLGGFFFYSSLYAAIGSAVNEDMREAQSLSFPVTLLIIFSISLMTIATSDPTGPVAVWGSIIPLTSPIVMMARIPFGIPGTVQVWELILSMGLLIAGFIFTTWFAGKIYRTGILMYGKKPTWKEMFKWAMRK